MNPRSKRRLQSPFLLIMIAMVFFLGWVVMLLWNAVLSPVLHVQTLNYWQGVGLLVLCRILFTGFRGGGFRGKPGWGGGPSWRQKWMNMSEEERAKFREEWDKRCHKPDR